MHLQNNSNSTTGLYGKPFLIQSNPLIFNLILLKFKHILITHLTIQQIHQPKTTILYYQLYSSIIITPITNTIYCSGMTFLQNIQLDILLKIFVKPTLLLCGLHKNAIVNGQALLINWNSTWKYFNHNQKPTHNITNFRLNYLKAFKCKMLLNELPSYFHYYKIFPYLYTNPNCFQYNQSDFYFY